MNSGLLYDALAVQVVCNTNYIILIIIIVFQDDKLFVILHRPTEERIHVQHADDHITTPDGTNSASVYVFKFPKEGMTFKQPFTLLGIFNISVCKNIFATMF